MIQRRHLTLMLMCLLSLGIPLSADYDDTNAGSRAAGMGNSFTALADDVFGLYYNPAGLGFVRMAQLGTDFGRLFAGLDDDSSLVSGFSALAFPLRRVEATETVVTVSSSPAVTSSSGTAVPEITTMTVRSAAYRHYGTVAVGWKYFSLLDHYQESAYYLSYGRLAGDRWSWGVNVKYLQERYTMNDYLRASPVFEYGQKESVQNISADVGVIYNLAPRFFIGISASDINQPNLGLREDDRLPLTSRIGVAWKEKGMAWAADGMFRRGVWYYSTGFEKYLVPGFGVRGGLAMGGRNYFTVNAGFSFNFYRAQLDYVFQYPLAGIKDVAGTHRLSLLFRFGRRDKDDAEVGSIEYYYAKLQNEFDTVANRLSETQKEKANLERILIEEATLRIRERIRDARAEARTVAAPQPARPAPEVKEPRIIKHTVRPGETLQSIAEKYYGSSKYWDEIYRANRENVGRGGALKPGQALTIPSLSRPDAVIPTGKGATIVRTESAAPAAGPAPAGTAAMPGDTPVPVKAVIPDAPAPPVPSPAPEKPVPVVVVAPAAPLPPAETASGSTRPPQRTQEKESARPPAVRQKPAGRHHVVEPGENLRIIAKKYYQNDSRWKEIYDANRDKIQGGQIVPGQSLIIP